MKYKLDKEAGRSFREYSTINMGKRSLHFQPEKYGLKKQKVV